MNITCLIYRKCCVHVFQSGWVAFLPGPYTIDSSLSGFKHPLSLTGPDIAVSVLRDPLNHITHARTRKLLYRLFTIFKVPIALTNYINQTALDVGENIEFVNKD